jgi:LPS-assembly protein
VRNFNGEGDRSFYETCVVVRARPLPGARDSGTTTRLSAQASYRRTFIDPIGQVWTPFSYLRGDAFYVAPQTDRASQNANIANFIETDDFFAGRATPAVGVEYRYPFVADAGAFGLHTVEPMAKSSPGRANRRSAACRTRTRRA